MKRRSAIRPFAAIATIGVLVFALGLAGCGRKGPLESPPGYTDPAYAPRPAPGPDAQPTPPAGPKKRLPIDWLLD